MANRVGVTLGGARFASVSDEDIASLVDNKDSANTKKATKLAVHVFEQYMKAKNICCNFESVTPTELNNLRRFWVEARKQNGEMYTKSSLTTIRFGLWRFIKNCRPEMDIMSSPEFQESNTVFKAQTVQLKREGKAKVQHKPPISEEDLCKLYSSSAFNTNHLSQKRTCVNCTAVVHSTQTHQLDYKIKSGLKSLCSSVAEDKKTCVTSRETLLPSLQIL